MIKYELPDHWIKYDAATVTTALVDAKAAVIALREMPYQREWVEDLQKIELKREVAGTSRIEGADFTERELDAALAETAEDLLTRSQRQARAAKNTYLWIAALPDDRPLDAELVFEIHRRIVTGADDDHCQPAVLRGPDENVNFGQPRHRGVDGGDACARAFGRFIEALQAEYRNHDPIVQALSAHYHFAAMHPFLDGNGRTARALEALLLQRAGLRDFCFIAMSNYYYDEKNQYLASLAAARASGHDLTPFLRFSLNGIEIQTKRLLGEIRIAVKKAIFRNLMFDLFNRLESKKKRVIAKRQIEILKLLLRKDMEIIELLHAVQLHYGTLRAPRNAFTRDLGGLDALGAIEMRKESDGRAMISVLLDWPETITETKFFEWLKQLPKSKSYTFLQR
jgi:Fic family protein